MALNVKVIICPWLTLAQIIYVCIHGGHVSQLLLSLPAGSGELENWCCLCGLCVVLTGLRWRLQSGQWHLVDTVHNHSSWWHEAHLRPQLWAATTACSHPFNTTLHFDFWLESHILTLFLVLSGVMGTVAYEKMPCGRGIKISIHFLALICNFMRI